MSVAVDHGYPTSPPVPQGQTQLSREAVERKASDILDVGDKWFRKDDYAARMDAFAREMATLDQPGRAALMKEVLEQDPGALQSWLKRDNLNGLVKQGRVTDLER